MKNDIQLLRIKDNGGVRMFHGSWYRGPQTKFLPNKQQLSEDNAIEKYVIQGYSHPGLISKNDKILSFGSCFAGHVTKFLGNRGYSVLGKDKTEMNSHVITFGEGIVNTFSILQQFEWAILNKKFEHLYWFGPNKEIALPGETERENTASLMEQASVFIFTLGVSEIWYDKLNGEAFWRAIPVELFDEKRHGFRVSTVQENIDNLNRIIAIVKTLNVNAKIIFTVSPVPLMATFRDISCISASTVSKSILRVAVDEVIRKDIQNVYYFPSYEIVKEYFNDAYNDDNRHPKQEVISEIMHAFEKSML